MSLQERVIDVTRMDHELGDDGPKTTNDAFERVGAQNASVNATHKLRRSESVHERHPIVTSPPRQHRGVQKGLASSCPPLLGVTPYRRPPFIRHTNHRDAEALGQ